MPRHPDALTMALRVEGRGALEYLKSNLGPSPVLYTLAQLDMTISKCMPVPGNAAARGFRQRCGYELKLLRQVVLLMWGVSQRDMEMAAKILSQVRAIHARDVFTAG